MRHYIAIALKNADCSSIDFNEKLNEREDAMDLERGQERFAKTFVDLSNNVEGLAYPRVAARFSETMGHLGLVEFDCSHVGECSARANVSSASEGGVDYAVSIRLVEVAEIYSMEKDDERDLWSSSKESNWKCYSSCSCPFFQESHSHGACKHVGALSKWVGEASLRWIEAWSISDGMAGSAQDQPKRIGPRL